MKKEISIGAVVFYKEKEIKYLVLQYDSKSKHWDYVKGHLEENENEHETLARELKEETGIRDFEVVGGFKEEIAYFFKKDKILVDKKVIFYLIESKTKDIKLSDEHSDYKWLGYEDAYQLVTFDTAKGVLKNANKFLSALMG